MAGLLENVGDAKRSMDCVIRVIASRQGLALPEVQLGVTVLALQKQRHMIGHKISHPGKRIESYLGRRRGRFSRDGGKMVPRKEQTGTDTDIRLQRCAGISDHKIRRQAQDAQERTGRIRGRDGS